MPGVNYGRDCAIFEAVHGNSPDIAGKGIANPIALLRSAILMLEYLKLNDMARNIDQAMRKVVREERAVTRDPGGPATTDEMCRAIIVNLH